MAHGEAQGRSGPSGAPTPPLILTLTRRCDLRCGFCPVELGPARMPAAVASRAVSLYLSRYSLARPRRHPGGSRGPGLIRFFGGEPLSEFPLLRALVEAVRARSSLRFAVATNGSRLSGPILEYFSSRPEIEVALSRELEPAAMSRLPNLVFQLCAAPEDVDGLAARASGLLAAGVRRFNVLPAYYVSWSEGQLERLERALSALAGLLLDRPRRGRPIEVRNLEVDNPAPLFNPGLVVDVDGSVFASNAAVCRPFAVLRDRLRLGSVFEPASLRWEGGASIRWDPLLREALDEPTLESTRRVDEALDRFVALLRKRGRTPLPAGSAA